MIAIVTSISAVLVAIVTIEKISKGAITRWLLSSVLDKLDKLDVRVDKLEKDNLKQIIMNDNIPLSERVKAGDRYIELNGNGEIKAHYKVLKEEYEEELKKKTKIKEKRSEKG